MNVRQRTVEQVDVEMYLLCKNNPRLSLSGGEEAARVFVIDMERELSKLPQESSELLLLAAQGFPAYQIALKMGISAKTVSKRLRDHFWSGRIPN